MDIGLAVMSAKDQIMIPETMRGFFVKGLKLFMLKENNKFMLEEMNQAKDEDLEFAIKTEEAWKRIEKGESIILDFDDFLHQLAKW
jgi:hypothetical protein